MLLAFAAIANAQGKLGFTVEAGLNLSKFSGDTDQLTAGGGCDMKAGFNIGVMANVPFTDAIYLKSGLKYTQRGWQKESKEDDGVYDEHETLGYLQLPILFSYRYAISDNIELQANVGPYLAYALHGKDADDDDIFEYYDYKRFDFGLVLPSVGVTISNFYVGVSNELGLVNLIDEEYYDEAGDYNKNKWHNYCFSINVGYAF